MRLSGSFAFLFLLSASATRAQAPLDTAAVLDSVAHEVTAIGARHGDSIWPNFRPDTIPLSFVLPSHGSFLFGWRGPLPAGYSTIDKFPGVGWRDERALGASSTGSEIAGRHVAQVAIGSFQPLETASLTATAVHEAFHVFERASKRPGARFGDGENAMLVSSYPLFDVDNEAAFALEGRILAGALAATSLDRKRELAREFVAVRRARHQRLSTEFVDFDQMSELNEGLANYALACTLRVLDAEGPLDWRKSAAQQLASMRDHLSDLTGAANLSLRFRFYQTGPAEALLLDELAGATWKQRLMAENLTLEDALGSASGLDAMAEQARERAGVSFDAAGTRTLAARRVDALRASRLAKVDSVLSAPGIRLVLAADNLPGHDFNSCGFDPQNLLPVTATVQIQTRWWKPCAGGPTYAEFNVPSVHDEAAGTVSAVIGAEGEIKLFGAGQAISVKDGETLRDVAPFKLEAPRASVDAVRADVSRSGNVITVRPKRP